MTFAEARAKLIARLDETNGAIKEFCTRPFTAAIYDRVAALKRTYELTIDSLRRLAEVERDLGQPKVGG